MKYCCAFVRQILTSRLFPGQRLNDCDAGAVWCNKCHCSYSGPWGHAFLPMYSTCLFTVSLLCLGLFQFLPLPLQLALIPVCVRGGSSTRSDLGCFQGKRNLSCLLRWRQISSSLSKPSILAEWLQSRCSPELVGVQDMEETLSLLSSSKPLTPMARQVLCAAMHQVASRIQSGFVRLTSIPLVAEVAQMSYPSPEQCPQSLLPAGLCKVSLAHWLARQHSCACRPAGCCHPLISGRSNLVPTTDFMMPFVKFDWKWLVSSRTTEKEGLTDSSTDEWADGQ